MWVDGVFTVSVSLIYYHHNTHSFIINTHNKKPKISHNLFYKQKSILYANCQSPLDIRPLFRIIVKRE